MEEVNSCKKISVAVASLADINEANSPNVAMNWKTLYTVFKVALQLYGLAFSRMKVQFLYHFCF